MKLEHFAQILSGLAFLWLSTTAYAEKAPLSAERRQAEADATVVAIVEKIRIDSEPARFERGWGNSDWGIYLTLRIEAVEKGDVDGESVEAKCFRIRSRRSMQGYLSPSGHRPIPETGTRVRVYLERRDNSWHVLLPNGITIAEGARALPDAKEVTQLRSLRYTYLLPLEGWLMALVIGMAGAAGFGVLKLRRRSPARAPVRSA